MKTKEFQITKDLEGLRLDQALARFAGSRALALQLISEGSVRVEAVKKEKKFLNPRLKNKTRVKPSFRVEKGDLVSYVEKIQLTRKENLEPYDFFVPIVYEDQSIMVVDKPAGLVVHPSPGHPNDSLVNALIHKLNPNVGGHSYRPGLVHRLDKDVSGLLVLSKTQKAQNFLSKQFLKRSITRKYQAVCLGPIRFDEGRIENYIHRHPVNRKKFISSLKKQGKKAITVFKVLKKRGNEAALVEFELFTGRTHQIRVHSLEFSEGIAGDSVYSHSKKLLRGRDEPLILKIKALNRAALHAVRLSFIHPETKKRVQFESGLPEKLRSLITSAEMENI